MDPGKELGFVLKGESWWDLVSQGLTLAAGGQTAVRGAGRKRPSWALSRGGA